MRSSNFSILHISRPEQSLPHADTDRTPYCPKSRPTLTLPDSSSATRRPSGRGNEFRLDRPWGRRYSPRRAGIVNVNVEPTPTWLVTQILPPWSSMNFRHRVSPSPVPSTFLSAVPTCRNSSNTASWSSGAMPTPVSLTEISTNPSFGVAWTSIDRPRV
jgi:hypothetical protein